MNSKRIIESAGEYVTVLLDKTLGEVFTYHNLNHTLHVVNSVSRLAREEGLNNSDTEIAIIAAWFHDTGFIVKYNDHEVESMRLAEHFLNSLDYPQDKIRNVTDCIAITRKGSLPGTHLQNILHDADYWHMLEGDYVENINKLRKELESVTKKSFTDKEWWESNLFFLKNHIFFTLTYQRLWKETKDHLIKVNIKILNEING